MIINFVRVKHLKFHDFLVYYWWGEREVWACGWVNTHWTLKLACTEVQVHICK